MCGEAHDIFAFGFCRVYGILRGMVMLRTIHILLLVLVMAASAVTAKGLPENTLKPKRKLTKGQQYQVQELKKKIAAERARLAEVKKPLLEAQKNLLGPQKQLATYAGIFSRIDNLVRDNERERPGSPKSKETVTKLRSEAKKLGKGSGTYGNISVEYYKTRLQYRPLYDNKKRNEKQNKEFVKLREQLAKIRVRMLKERSKFDGKLKLNVQKLDDIKRSEERKFDQEAVTLEIYLAKLKSIYGYQVENAAILFADEATDGGKVSLWLDEQGRLIEKLSVAGFDDLASEYFSRIRKANNPYTGKPLSDNSLNYMNKIGARLKMQKALYVNDIRQKLLLSQESVSILEQVVRQLIPNTPAYMDARIDLSATKFKLAADIVESAKAEALVRGKFPWLLKAGANSLVDKKTRRVRKFSEKGLEKLRQSQLLEQAVLWAAWQYEDGIKSALDLHDGIRDIFMDLIDNYMYARDIKDSALERKYYKLLLAFSPRKLNNQHEIEKAYGGWLEVFEPGSAQRSDIGGEANEFVEANLEDYQQIWPNDKLVYINWIALNGEMPDPVSAKDSKGKPLASFIKPDDWDDLGKEEREEEILSMVNYPWASDRVENIFKWYLVGRGKDRADKNAAVQNYRERGYYARARALSHMTINTYLLGQSQPDAMKKEALLAHAAKLNDLALQAMEGFDGKMTAVGHLSEFVCSRGLLLIKVNHYLFLARYEADGGRGTKAAEYSAKALEIAAKVKSTGSSEWSRLAGEALVLVAEFNRQNKIAGSDSPDSWPVALLATKAEDSLRQGLRAQRDGKSSKAQDSFLKSQELYLVLLDKYRKINEKSERAAGLVKALYNLGVVAQQQGDYVTALIANQSLLQEFRNDFKDPAKNYAFSDYPEVAKYFEKAANNLRAAASRQKGLTGSERDKRNYVQALLMNVRASGRGEDYVALVNEFRNMGEYARAVEFIDNIPADNDYYRLIQLMASSIYLDMIARETREVKAIDSELNPPRDEDGKVLAGKEVSAKRREELLGRKAGHEKVIAGYGKQADKYARKFVDLHTAATKEWEQQKRQGVKVTAAVSKIRKQERENLLKAMLIPMLMAYEAQRWDEVIRRAPEYYSAVNKRSGVSAGEKAEYLVNSSWMHFLAQYNQVDYKTARVEECEQNLKKAAEAQTVLARYDTANRMVSAAAAILGSSWLELAARAQKEGKEALVRQMSLNAVNWLDKAERQIYDNINLGIAMGATLTEQKLYDRAESTLQKVIGFWSESLFTPASLFQSGKSAGEMKSMSAAVANNLNGQFDQKKIEQAKRDGKALAKVLNEMVVSVRFEDNPSGFNKAISAAIQAAGADHELISSLRQAQEIAGAFASPSADAQELLQLRPYLKNTPSAQQRSRLNRIILEAAYPEVLFRQALTPLLPAPAVTLQQTYVLSRGYRSDEGRKKAAVLMAMIDPLSVRGSSYGKVVFGEDNENGKGGFVGEITAKLEAVKNPQQRQLYSDILEALEKPLVVSLYGKPDDRGRLEERNYAQTVKSINAMLAYDKLFKSSEKLPVAAYLKGLQRAIRFQNLILYAKKNYAKAMVENGQYAKAEKYVRELSVLFPADWTLSLDLGEVYTQMAKYEQGARSNQKLRAYTRESAADYLLGIMQINSVLKYAENGTVPYWQAKMMILENGVSSIEARKKAAVALQGGFEVEVDYFEQVSGKTEKLRRRVEPMDEMAKFLVIEILRTMEKVNPAPPRDVMDKLRDYLQRLQKLGYSRPDVG